MKNWKWLLPVPAVLVFAAMAPQSPQGAEVAADAIQVVRMTELQYVDAMGKTTSVPSKNVVEIRILEDALNGIRFEVCYDNGDYSQVQAQAMHILRSGRDPMDVRFVRSRAARMRFPKLP